MNQKSLLLQPASPEHAKIKGPFAAKIAWRFERTFSFISLIKAQRVGSSLYGWRTLHFFFLDEATLVDSFLLLGKMQKVELNLVNFPGASLSGWNEHAGDGASYNV